MPSLFNGVCICTRVGASTWLDVRERLHACVTCQDCLSDSTCDELLQSILPVATTLLSPPPLPPTPAAAAAAAADADASIDSGGIFTSAAAAGSTVVAGEVDAHPQSAAPDALATEPDSPEERVSFINQTGVARADARLSEQVLVDDGISTRGSGDTAGSSSSVGAAFSSCTISEGTFRAFASQIQVSLFLPCCKPSRTVNHTSIGAVNQYPCSMCLSF